MKPDREFYSGPALQSHESLLAYFPSDDGTGVTLNDMSISASHSSLEGGAGWAAGKYSQAVSFDGQNDYVAIKTDGLLNDLHKDSYSISFWVRPTDPPPRKVYPRSTQDEGLSGGDE